MPLYSHALPLADASVGGAAAVVAIVAAIASATLIALAVHRWRGRAPVARGGGEPAPAMVCPACGGGQPEGALFCPHDAQRLVPVGSAGAEVARGPLLRCPRCVRAFTAATRFCPYDAEELVVAPPQPPEEADDGPGGLEIATSAGAVPGIDAGLAADALAGDDKICPVCATKYALAAQYCGRDGSELSSMN